MYSEVPTIIALSNVSTVLPFIFSTGFVLRSFDQKEFVLLWAFYGIATMTEFIYHTLSLLDQPNGIVAHIYTLIEYGLLAYIMSVWEEDVRISKGIKVSILFYSLVYAIIKVSGVETFQSSTINYVSRPLALLLLASFALHAIFAHNGNAPSSRLINYRYWILLAIALYYSASALIIPFFYVESHDLLVHLFYVHAVINILHNLLFTVGIIIAWMSCSSTA